MPHAAGTPLSPHTSQLKEYCDELEAKQTDEGSAGGSDGSRKPKPLVAALELQRLFVRLQGLDRRSISTEALTRYGFGWFSAEAGVQHDVQELNRLLYDKIEKQLSRSSGRDIIPRLYTFSTGYRKTFLAPQLGVQDSTVERAYDITVPVAGNEDLVSALAATITPQFFDGLEAPNGERCPALRGQVLTELPPVLVIMLNRTGMNMTTFEPMKVEDRCAFPLALDMAPFLQGGVVSAAVQADVVRAQGLKADAQGNPLPADAPDPDPTPMSVPAALAAARAGSVWLSDDLTSPEVAARSLAAEQPAGDSSALYDLFSVVIHAGTASAGHYTAYIRDMAGEGTWSVPESALAPPKEVQKARDAADARAKALSDPTSPLTVLRSILAAQPQGADGRYTVSFSDLGAEISRSVGRSWNKTYKKQWGTLKAFMRQHPSDFKVEGDSVTLIPQQDAGKDAPPPSVSEDGWTTVGGPRQPAAGAGDTASPAEEDESARRAAARAHQEKLADLWGRWFDFNDSSVSPITAATLESQFQGRESGYILMYRSREMGQRLKTALPPAAKQGTAAPTEPRPSAAAAAAPAADGEQDGVGLINPLEGAAFVQATPSPWAEEVAESNAAAEAHRTAYETARHTITVNVHPASLYSQDKAGCRLRFNVEAAEALREEHGSGDAVVATQPAAERPEGVGDDVSAEDAAAIAAALADTPAPSEGDAAAGTDAAALAEAEDAAWRGAGIAVTVDTRWTVRRFVQELQAKVPPALWPEGTRAEPRSDASPLALHSVQRVAGGMHLYDAVLSKGDGDATPTVEEKADSSALLNPWERPLTDFEGTVVHKGVLLLWDGETVDGGAVATGADAEPLEVVAHFLREAVVPGEGGGAAETKVLKNSLTMVVPKNTTLQGMKRTLMAAFERAGAPVAEPETNLGLFRITTSSTGNVRAAHLDKLSAAEMLAATSKGGSGILSQTLGQLGMSDEAELALEPLTDAKGKKRFMPLASSEAKKRSSTLHITVTVAPGVLRPDVDAAQAAAAAGSSMLSTEHIVPGQAAAAAGEDFILPLTVERSTTIAMLKRKVLRLLGWADSLPFPGEEDVKGGSAAPKGGPGGIPAPGAVSPVRTRRTVTTLDRVAGLCRMRSTYGSTPASLVDDETDQLHAVGVFEGGHLILEEGKPLGSAEIALRYAIVTGNAHTKDGEGGVQSISKELVISRTASATQLKRSILLAEGMTPAEAEAAMPERRLRKTNFADERQAIVQQEGMSLNKHSIYTGQLVLLEEGAVPKPGQLTLKLFVWTPEHAAIVASKVPPSIIPSATDGGVQHVPPEGEVPLDAWEWSVRARSACLWPVSDVTCSREQQVRDLKQAILNMKDVAHARAVAEAVGRGEGDGWAFDPKGLKARAAAATAAGEAEEAGSPPLQRAGSTGGAKEGPAGLPQPDTVPSLAEQGITPDRLRLREVTAVKWPGKVLKPNLKVLMRCGVKTGGAYVVEVLPEAESLTDRDVLLWVQHRRHASPTTPLNTPFWPPTCFKWSVTDAPRLTHLQEALAPLAAHATGRELVAAAPGQGQMVASDVAVAKWFPSARGRVSDDGPGVLWRRITAKSQGAVQRGGGGGRRGRRGKLKPVKGSLLKAPFNIKDGDLLAVQVVDTGKLEAEAAVAKAEGLEAPVDPVATDMWLRPEDEALVQREHARVIALREERKAAGRGGGGGGRSAAPQAILSLGGDDSDDYGAWGEEEEDGGGAEDSDEGDSGDES